MDAIWKSTIQAYMSQLYSGGPEGPLLESIKKFEERFTSLADEHEGEMDIAGILGTSGLQDEYNQLYMAVRSGSRDYTLPQGDDKPRAFDHSQQQRLPSVHEFIDTYRVVYEAVRPDCSEEVSKAYEALFAVEDRTDDLVEAQMIIEREHLVLDTVTASCKSVIKEFMEASDPNYEITSSTVNATLGRYVTGKSLDDIVYISEKARSITADLAVQAQVKTVMLTNFYALIYGWEYSKKKIREGSARAGSYGESMILTRYKTRDYYRFMSEDMGITFDVIESRPFYRIMMLSPSPLDALCRVKKIMHPDNIAAIKYVLFEEILSDRPLEEILLAPQKVPFYEQIDTIRYPDMDREFAAAAADLNKDIPYYQKNRRAEMMEAGSSDAAASGAAGSDTYYRSGTVTAGGRGDAELICKIKKLNGLVAAAPGQGLSGTSGVPGMASGVSGISGNIAKGLGGMKNMPSDTKKETAKSAAAGVAAEVGKGLLRGLFRN